MYTVANCALGQYTANEVVILSSFISIKDKKYYRLKLMRFLTINIEYNNVYQHTFYVINNTESMIKANVKLPT